MDPNDAAVVRSELVALQAVLIAVCRRLARDAPELAPALCGAFDDAEVILTGVAMRMGLEDPGGSAVAALRIVEEIRAGVISDQGACAGGNGGDARRQRQAADTKTPRP